MEGGGGQFKGSVSPSGVAHNGITLSEPQTATPWTAPYTLSPKETLNEQGTSRLLPNKATCVRVCKSVS